MKKLIVLIFCLGLILSLTACGTSGTMVIPAGTEAPLYTDAPDLPDPPAESPQTGDDTSDASAPEDAGNTLPADAQQVYPIIVPIGESVNADLDLDGIEETVCVSLREDYYGMSHPVLKINGVDCSDYLACEGLTQLEDPDTEYYAITDLYSGDPSLEIAIQDWGPSDDCYTNFYRFSDGQVRSIGGVPGLIKAPWGNGSITFDGNGNIFTSNMRLHVLQTWFTSVTYVLNNAEILEMEPQDLYTANNPTEVTLNTDLTAYDGKDGDKFTVDAGVEMTVEATDNQEWIYCTSESEDWALWFHLNPEYAIEIESPNGFIPVSEALTGLCFAD